MAFGTRSLQARNYMGTPISLGASRNPMSYQQELDVWLAAAGRSEHGSRVVAAELCRYCNQSNESILILPPGRLTKLPPLPGHIEQLHAPNNKIKSLPSLHYWPANLKGLYLQKNRITKIEGQNLPDSLAVLDVSDNRIKSLKDPFPFSLRIFIGSGNQLEDLPVDWPSNLEELTLRKCGLYFFPDGLPDRLQSVDVSSNPIERVSRQDIPIHLRELSLASTGIKCIPDGLPSSLRALDVSRNNFDHFGLNIIDPKSFPDKITKVDFRGCNLIRPPQFLSKLLDAATIDFRGNQFSEKGRHQALEMEAMNSSGLHLKVTGSSRPLANEVNAWLFEHAPHLSHDPQIEEWTKIQNLPGRKRDMQAFSGFLGRLRQTQLYQNFDQVSALRQRVCHLVVALPNNEPLRERCIQISQEVVDADDVHLPDALVNMESEHLRWSDEEGRETQIIRLETRSDYRQACLNPQPHATYHYHDLKQGNNDLTFTTDHLGRTVNSAGQLRIATEKQRFHDDSQIGYPHNPDALRGDIGFHAGANQFGFPGGALNVFPGNHHLNSSNGAYGQYENDTLRPLVEQGETVHAQFTRRFKVENPTTRPDTMQIIYKADGQPRITRTFINISEPEESESSGSTN